MELSPRRMNKINILFIASSVEKCGGLSGGDRIFLELSKRLCVNHNVVIYGWEATEILCKKYGVSHLFKSIGGIPSYVTKIRTLSYIARTIITTLFIRRDIRLYSRDDTVVISASDFWPDSIPAYLLSRFYNYYWASSFFLVAPDVFLSHGSHKGLKRIIAALFSFSQSVIIRMIRSYSSLLITCSKDVISAINGRSYLPLDYFFLYGGVTIDSNILKLRDTNIANPKYDVVYMARLHPQKGPIEMVRIWEEVLKINPKLHLAMIGNGPLENKVKELIESLELKESVELFGFVDGVDKLNIFSNSRLFAHPVIYDTGGMAPMEAMVIGIPAISFDLKGLRDAYPKGMHKVSKYNIKEFAQGIIEILDSKKRYNTMRKDAIELSYDWNWDKHSFDLQKKLLKLLKKDNDKNIK